MTKVVLAYPSAPPALSELMRLVAERAIQIPSLDIKTWERPDTSGAELISTIIEAIEESDLVVADLTSLNFNVVYELGYTIGLGKRVIPSRYAAYDIDKEAISKIGLFDTLLVQTYTDSDNLVETISQATVGRRIATVYPLDPSPVYIVLPPAKTEEISKLKERTLKAGLRSRDFDPSENARLGPTEAVRAVAASAGIIIPLMEAGIS